MSESEWVKNWENQDEGKLSFKCYVYEKTNNNNNKENKRINGTSARFKVKRWYPSLIFISLREAVASEKKLASWEDICTQANMNLHFNSTRRKV